MGWGWRYNRSGPKQRWRCQGCGCALPEDDGFLGSGRSGGDLRRMGSFPPGDDSRRDRETPPGVLVRQDIGAGRPELGPRLLAPRLGLRGGEDGGSEGRRGDAVARGHRNRQAAEGPAVRLAPEGTRASRPADPPLRAVREGPVGRARGGPPEGGVGEGPRLAGADRERREWSFERAYQRVLGLKHRDVRMVCGVPIDCRRHALKRSNNPGEQAVRELKDWHRHMNGFASDRSAADLLRGWVVHVNVVNTHGRSRTWAERAGLCLGLPQEDRILRLIQQAIEWGRSRLSPTNR